ncbi:hypothetical protein ACVWXM_005720 [Bradyrhizobium sp. GM7.3]
MFIVLAKARRSWLRQDDTECLARTSPSHAFAASHAKIISTICALLFAGTSASLRSRSNRAPIWFGQVVNEGVEARHLSSGKRLRHGLQCNQQGRA